MGAHDLLAVAYAYADKHRLLLDKQLGSGMHGIVHAIKSQSFPGQAALKVHRDLDTYLREKEIYARLGRLRVHEIEGFNVPQFISCDDNLQAFEMTVVNPPFLLDFAGAYLDELPEFPEGVWEEGEAEQSERFGERWSIVQTVLARLQALGIYMVDPSPTNIRFE